MNPQPFARLARDARLLQEAQSAFLKSRGYASAKDVPDAYRESLNRQWSVSSEKARLDIALARVDDLPCAAYGLTSYRYRGEFGAVMIGAAHEGEALKEAERSISGKPNPTLLDVWNGEKYVPVFP